MSYLVQKPCKVCGKMYTPCGYCEKDKSAFHWRTVACSKKCGQEYLKRVTEARNSKVKISKIEENKKDNINENETFEYTKKTISKYKKKNKESEQID